MSSQIAYARILNVSEVSGRLLYEIAVQSDFGEFKAGEIDGDNLVTADGLIVGILTGTKESGQTFRPMRMVSQKTGNEILARITGFIPNGYGKWAYTWVEVERGAQAGTYEIKTDGKDSNSNGLAINTVETPNESGGILGSGVNSSNLPNGFDPVPVGIGAVVKMSGPYQSATLAYWEFELSTHVDGSCSGDGS